MKLINKIIMVVGCMFALSSCKDYLEIPVEGMKTDKELFGDYYAFQDFVDRCYLYVIDPIETNRNTTASFGGEGLSSTSYMNSYRAVRGDYSNLHYGWMNHFGRMWPLCWTGIRHVNIGLSKLDQMVGTQEEKDLIEGQLRFFRAYYHFTLIMNWGSMPYITEVLDESNMEQARYYEYNGKLNYQACTEHISEDLDLAAQMLPAVWKDPEVNFGRVTSLAARGYQARALLYAGSPMMNRYSGGASEYNKEYMERAAIAANEVMKLELEHSTDYHLVPVNASDANDRINQYIGIFVTTDTTVPWSTETLFGRYPQPADGWGGFGINEKPSWNGVWFNIYYASVHNRIFLPNHAITGAKMVTTEAPTQTYVDKFEMADGSLYQVAYDKDNDIRWDYRDPRFDFNFYVDRDYMSSFKGRDDLFKCDFWTSRADGTIESGKSRTTNTVLFPYFMRKFWPYGVDDLGWDRRLPVRMMTPLLRLPDVYLMYAEAVNEWKGNPDVLPFNDAVMTPVEAVNLVRERVGHVPIDANGKPVPLPTGADKVFHEDFAAAVANERAVELSYESEYWYDFRRRDEGASMGGESIETLNFSEDWKPESFVRSEVVKRVYLSPKHDWMPLPAGTKIYESFPQNEGWD